MKRLSADDVLSLKFLRGGQMCPAGTHVVYCVSRTDTEEHFELWVNDLAGVGSRRIAFTGQASAPRWSPDGASIAFVGDGRLYVASFPNLAVSGPFTPEGWSVEGPASWDPSGTLLAVALLRTPPSAIIRRVASREFRSDGVGYLAGREQSIHIVDPCNRSCRRLTFGTDLCMRPAWSPRGSGILFLATNSAIAVSPYSPRLMCVDVGDGTLRELLEGSWYVMAADWLPNGEGVVVAAAHDSDLIVPRVGLWTVSLGEGRAERRTEWEIETLGFRIHHDMPSWDLTENNVFAILDQDTAFVTVQSGGRVEIRRVALSGPRRDLRLCGGERSCIALDANKKTGALLFASTDFRTPPELYVMSTDGQREKRLTAFNDQILSQWPTIAVDSVDFRSADGLDIEAWTIASSEGRMLAPTVLFIHGGPYIATGVAFRYDLLLLVSNGFRVLFANFRGSAGYGEAFARAITGDWGRKGFPDHMGAIDEAVRRGFSNRNRIGVWGASHGGFATCWLVGHSDRFKAAVAEAPVTNFVTAYYLSDAPDAFARELGGRPDEIPEIYRDRSPLSYAHRCRTPTLLIHGDEDYRCTIAESEQFHRALLDAGCTTELVRISGCSHLGDSLGPLPARTGQNAALLEWFTRHL